MSKGLTLKQKSFCNYYLDPFTNATEAVIKAGYNVSKKNGSPNRVLAKSMASENLRKPSIIQYIQKKLEKEGFDDTSIMKQHLFLINQCSDLSVKAKAIDMYYKKTGAYSALKLEHGVDLNFENALERMSKLLP